MNQSSPHPDAVEIEIGALSASRLATVTETGTPHATRLTFGEAFPLFHASLEEQKLAENTIKAFAHDLAILGDYFKEETPVQNIITEDLQSFLHWMEHARGIACSKKSLSRRITSLKSFFRWLHQQNLLAQDPAGPIKQVQAQPYTPTILNKSETRQLLETASGLFWQQQDPDARPLLLLSLLLQTGMKKQECVNLYLSDFNFAAGHQATVAIRHTRNTLEHKTRILPVSSSIRAYMDQYRQQYQISDEPSNLLFSCTARNLEYVLKGLSQTAGLVNNNAGFETLRWTCIVNDFRMGMPDGALRRKLGLSKGAWRDTRAKIMSLL